METITIHKAKTELSRLIERACRGEEIVIARGKKPVVRLVAIGDKKGQRKPGALRGKLKVGPEFFEPLPREELDGWEGPRATSAGHACIALVVQRRSRSPNVVQKTDCPTRQQHFCERSVCLGDFNEVS